MIVIRLASTNGIGNTFTRNEGVDWRTCIAFVSYFDSCPCVRKSALLTAIVMESWMIGLVLIMTLIHKHILILLFCSTVKAKPNKVVGDRFNGHVRLLPSF